MTDLWAKIQAAREQAPKSGQKSEPFSDKSNITIRQFAENHGWGNQLTQGIISCSWIAPSQFQEIQDTKVFIHHKLRKVAGMAQWTPKRRILLHPVYSDDWEKDEFASEMKETFFHEVAHIFAFYGNDFKHGPLWKAAMQYFGYLPRIYYDGTKWDYKNYRTRKEKRFLGMLELYTPKKGK